MFLNINKPSGMTSHDVVDRVRRMTGERTVGHAGTLDPFATGVLVVGVTRAATKQLGTITKGTDKEYIATVFLGKTSTTGDPEGTLTVTASDALVQTITRDRVEKALMSFAGTIQQTPPAYSAIKVNGVPAYKLARRGKTMSLTPRAVTISSLELLQFHLPEIQLRVVCSAGTYIRVLAEDIGKALGVGGYLSILTRTRVGHFRIEESQSL